MKILVVDDDDLAGAMTAAILEGNGYTAIVADNGVHALEQLNDHPEIDCIISDLNMPMINGIELFWELRAQGVALPFILLTGDDPQVSMAKEPAMDGCLMKDGSLEESLPSLVQSVLARHHKLE
ncbi:MAG: response regulator [Magnetococcus sp. DMHC-6]